MRERDSDTHPVPDILVALWPFTPVSHEEQRLNDDQAVDLDIKIVKQLLSVVTEW